MAKTKRCTLCGRPEVVGERDVVPVESKFLCSECYDKAGEFLDEKYYGDDEFLCEGCKIQSFCAECRGETLIEEDTQTESSVEEKTQDESTADYVAYKEIKANILLNELNACVIGQESAMKGLAASVYIHNKMANRKEFEFMQKENILIIGPTGTGKTYSIKMLAELLGKAFVSCDSTKITQAGYIGDDADDMLRNLYIGSNRKIQIAQNGVVFLDEIDKLAANNKEAGKGVNDIGAQQTLLKMLDGDKCVFNDGSISYKNNVEIETKNILFICSGAFVGLEEIIKKRLKVGESKIGYSIENNHSSTKITTAEILSKVTPEDLIQYGLMPEFIGRFSSIITLREMTEDLLIRILEQSKSSPIQKYKLILRDSNVRLEVTAKAYREIALQAIKLKTGARALNQVIQSIMRDVIIEVEIDPEINRCIIDEKVIRGEQNPKYFKNRTRNIRVG